MIVNDNIKPRPLTEAELADRKRGVFDSYANYIVFCGKCGRMQKTNMYVMRAEAYIDELNAAGKTCHRAAAGGGSARADFVDELGYFHICDLHSALPGLKLKIHQEQAEARSTCS